MTQRWSETQVSALAPDTSSLTAARRIAGRWSGTGSCGTALWGLCKGSGGTPYQTIVDLSGPTFRCSCPSHKFPCKHALSLLLLWAGGTVETTSKTADFAEEWIGRRVEKAAAPPEKNRAPNPVSTQQRRGRVDTGAAELDTWLVDQVRTGLARTDRSHQGFEAIAARMVDAQAPGIAAALRRLPTAMVGRPDWPQVVLGRFAWLRLLITAHAKLDTLSEPLAATVRSHIGYPTATESVYAEPAIVDRWLTVALRTFEEDRLHTRRSWLLGLCTGRWALLLDRSHGSPIFSTQLPPPGLAAEYALHFYPVAAPLRALAVPPDNAAAVASEPATGELTTVLASGTIAAGLRTFATAIAADPWLESWPVLLHSVTPVQVGEDWLLAEADGTAIPLVEPAQPWRLLAVSGGRPVTVFGLWTGLRLEVVSAGIGAEFHDAGPIAAATYSAVTATPDAASRALLGTARGAFRLPGLPDAVAAAAAALPGTDTARHLLDAAAMENAWSRGGYLPIRTEVPTEIAEHDPRPVLPRTAADRLRLLIDSRPEFLPEWFDAVEPHDYRAPDLSTGQLLEFAAGEKALREPVLRLAGTRGRWLAGLFPRWHDLIRRDTTQDGSSAETWRLGVPPERIRWLAALRHRDPAAALEALEKSWPRESGPSKSELLAVLADGLAPADENLLERALSDRRRDVRRQAAELLARLPDSAFAARMAERADAWMKCAPSTSSELPELVVDIPETLDEAAGRDGFTESIAEFGYRWNGSPDRTAAWFQRLVALLPMHHWARLLGAPPRAVTVRIDDRFRQPLFDGWMEAALTQRDAAWAPALFSVGMPSYQAILQRRELFALIPAEDQPQHLLRLDTSWLSELESLLPALAQPWPQEVARHLLHLFEQRARTAARQGSPTSTHPNAHRSLLHTAARLMPPEYAGDAADLAQRCEEENWAMAISLLSQELHQRSAMLEELK